MKKHLLLLLFFVSIYSNGLFSQTKTEPNSYEITGNTLISQEDFYKRSIEKANLENYRLKSQRVSLSFENGFVLELLSAEEMLSKNKTFDINSYQVEFPKKYVLPLFKVLPTGELVAVYLNQNKGKQ